MNYPTTYEGLMIFNAAIGAIAGTIAGTIQYSIDHRWKGWRSVLDFIAWYPLIWSGISVACAPSFISLVHPYGLTYADIGEINWQTSIMIISAFWVPACCYFIPKWMDRKHSSSTDDSSNQN